MRSNKPYTNVTFRKRVDHDGGRHGGVRASKEPRVCSQCGAMYAKRRWTRNETPSVPQIVHEAGSTAVICPSCRQTHSGSPCGFVYVAGTFVGPYVEDIERLLRNEAERAAADNPMARVMTWDRARPGALELTTTTPHLAKRPGHALEKALSGDVRYQFSHENQVARVAWRRD